MWSRYCGQEVTEILEQIESCAWQNNAMINKFQNMHENLLIPDCT